MKLLSIALLISTFNLYVFSQTDTTDFLIRNRGTREVVKITGNKAIAFKLIRMDTKYGEQWRMERIAEVDTMLYNNRGEYVDGDNKLRVLNEGFMLMYRPGEERSLLKVRMIKDGYHNPNALVNSSYQDCKVDSLEEVLMGVSSYFHGFGYYSHYYYMENPWEGSLANPFQEFESYKSEFDPAFQRVGDSLVHLHTKNAAFTDSILNNFNSLTCAELDSAFQYLEYTRVGWSYSKAMVNTMAVKDPSRFCQWVEQTSVSKRIIYNYADRSVRKSLKASDTKSPVKKELLWSYRGEVALGTTVTTLALSFYGALGVGIANLIAVNR